MSVSQTLPSKPNKESLKLVYCGRILSDFDILCDVLATGKNSGSTPVIHAIVQNERENSSAADSPGTATPGSGTDTVEQKTEDALCFDPVSLEFVRNELQKEGGEQQEEASGGHSTDNGHGLRWSRETRAHMENVLIRAQKSQQQQQQQYGVGSSGSGDVSGAAVGAAAEAPIPRPRWVDFKLIMRMLVTGAIFCRHWSVEKLYWAAAGCFVFYLLDTGIFRYCYRVLSRWSRAKAQQRRQPGLGQGQGQAQGQGVPVEVQAPGQAHAPAQQQQQQEPARGGGEAVVDVVGTGLSAAIDGLQQWIIGGFYIPENPPPPPVAPVAPPVSATEGGVATSPPPVAVVPPPPPPPATLAGRVLTFFVDWFSLLLGFVLCLFPSWTVDGMEIPW